MKLFLTAIFSAAVFLVSPGYVRGDECPQCQADFAIYNPDYEDDGVWEEEVAALADLFVYQNSQQAR